MVLKKYPVMLFKDPGENDWGLTVYDIPINILEPTLQDCLDEVQAAIEDFMIDEKELPEPTDLEVVAMSERAEDARIVTVVEVDTAFFNDPTKPKTLSAKQSEWEMIDRAAKKAGKKRSQFLVMAAREWLERAE